MSGIREWKWAARSLKSSPIATLTAVVSLALGLGANGVMLGVIDAAYFAAPPGVTDAARVVRVYLVQRPRGNRPPISAHVSAPHLAEIAKDDDLFSSTAAYITESSRIHSSSTQRSVNVTWVMGDFFSVLGVSPAIGRFFDLNEMQPRAEHPVAVVSYRMWQQWYAGNPRIVGTTINLDGQQYTVIGVAPVGFAGADRSPVDVWAPIGMAYHSLFNGILPRDWTDSPTNLLLLAIGRLAPGVREQQASQRLATTPDLLSPDGTGRLRVSPLAPGRGPEVRDSIRLGGWISGAALCVLLLACTNVSMLSLARFQRRLPELAIRSALGQSQLALMRDQVMEGMLLALLAGAAAVPVMLWTGTLSQRLFLGETIGQTTLSGRVLLEIVTLVLIVAGVTSAAPAGAVLRSDLALKLRAGSRLAMGRRSRVRAIPVTLQISLSLILLAGTGLLLRSLNRLQRVPIGFEPNDLYFITADLIGAGYSNSAITSAFAAMRDRVASIQNISGVAIAASAPFSGTFRVPVRLSGGDSLLDSQGAPPRFNAVSANFFAVLQTPLLLGRSFSAADADASAPVVIVSQSLARAAWPGADPITKCLILLTPTQPCAEVVGVVANVRDLDLTRAAPMSVYITLKRNEAMVRQRILLVRARTGTGNLAPRIRRAAQDAIGDVAYVSVQAANTAIAPIFRPSRLGTIGFGVFGGLALLLSACGMYGLLSYTVSEHRREIGIRLALGATDSQILRYVAGRGIRLAGPGVLLGVCGSLSAGHALRAFLFGASPLDPLVLAIAASVVLMVLVAASLGPALRALRIDPSAVLRSEAPESLSR